MRKIYLAVWSSIFRAPPVRSIKNIERKVKESYQHFHFSPFFNYFIWYLELDHSLTDSLSHATVQGKC